jgi:cytidylate kinase
MADLIITIDGPAASGKSTAAQRLAERLGATFLDTGAMYRAVTLAAMQAGVDMTDEGRLLELLKQTDFQFGIQEGKTTAHINGIDVTDLIRLPEVTANARHVASAPKVREKLVQMQRGLATRHKRIITEGRDQGTVAFPDADVKFFLTAALPERARRRQAELETKADMSFEQIQKAIEERDKSDQSRGVGPLKPPDDAAVIDTTDLSIEEVVERLLCRLKEKRLLM